MKEYKDKKQFRYKGYDYSQDGFYFITICTKNREMSFGNVVDSKMVLSEIGLIADKFWKEIPYHFPFVKLDEFMIMPNHIHGIIVIDNDCRNAPRRVHVHDDAFSKNAPRRVPTGIQPLVKNSLSSIINHFKGDIKRFCNKNNLEYFTWQPRFYDRIIRNEEELNKIREYIINNPLKWELDRNNLEDLFM